MNAALAPKAGVVGLPVNHSLSPKLHNYWLKRELLQGIYLPLPVLKEDVKDAFSLFPKLGFVGWNVTVPHKETAFKLVDELDGVAKRIGAVNTVSVQPDGKLLGTNTDAYGFLENLKRGAGDLTPYLSTVMILGAGGAARAIIEALGSSGAKRIIIANRTREKAEELAKAFPYPVETCDWERRERQLEEVTLLVNTTSLGMVTKMPLEISLETLRNDALVTDIVYTPAETNLLAEARAKGCKTVGGIGMLIHQAIPGFKAWFGKTPEVTGQEADILLTRSS